MIKKRTYKKGTMALSQILILILGTIAFTYIIGSSIGFVSATENLGDPCVGVGDNPTCASGYCDGTVCAERPAATIYPDGSPCILPSSSDPTCLSGYCDSTSRCGIAPASTNPPAVTSGQPATAITTTTTLIADLSQGCGTDNSKCQSGICISDTCVPSSSGNTNISGLLTVTAGGLNSTTPATPVDWGKIGGIVVSLIKDIGIAAGAAAAVYAGLQWLKATLGVTPGSQWNYLYTGAQFIATGAVFGALAIPSVLTDLGVTAASAGFWGSALGGGLIGAGLALIAYLALYKTTKIDAVLVNCVPWQAPTGGNDCAKCGQNGLPCTAYQCTSLGQACKLENGQTGQGKPICVWADPHDIVPPTMTFLNVLPSGVYLLSINRYLSRRYGSINTIRPKWRKDPPLYSIDSRNYNGQSFTM